MLDATISKRPELELAVGAAAINRVFRSTLQQHHHFLIGPFARLHTQLCATDSDFRFSNGAPSRWPATCSASLTIAWNTPHVLHVLVRWFGKPATCFRQRGESHLHCISVPLWSLLFACVPSTFLTLTQKHRESILVKPVNTPITPLCSKFSLSFCFSISVQSIPFPRVLQHLCSASSSLFVLNSHVQSEIQLNLAQWVGSDLLHYHVPTIELELRHSIASTG
jgi:hypothetical protein